MFHATFILRQAKIHMELTVTVRLKYTEALLQELEILEQKLSRNTLINKARDQFKLVFTRANSDPSIPGETQNALVAIGTAMGSKLGNFVGNITLEASGDEAFPNSACRQRKRKRKRIQEVCDAKIETKQGGENCEDNDDCQITTESQSCQERQAKKPAVEDKRRICAEKGP